MIQTYIKNGVIKYLNVENDKVYITIELDGFKVTNPTLEQFKSVGWVEYTTPTPEPEPYIPTLEELVEQKLRERYSINQEFEVQRKRDVETEAFEEYYAFVEKCIEEAKKELNNK